MSSPLPANVHISHHPCLRTKLSQLRSKHTNARDTKALVHEIALIIGCEALGTCLQTTSSGTDETPLGYSYTPESIAQRVVLVPILRSGLGMIDALQTLLPHPVPVHHLGLFRQPTSLQPVEYYNNLPYHRPSTSSPSSMPDLAIIVDPVIATGGTAAAAIQTLFEWGVGRVVVISVLGSEEGVRRAAVVGDGEGEGRVEVAGSGEDRQAVEVWVGALDKEVNDRGMIRPGIGDLGDRLFLTIGK